MTQKIKNLIEQHVDLIENNDFETLFNYCSANKDQGELADVLLSAGINFLDHIDYISSFMFMNSRIKRLVIPNNIKRIGMGAFFSCDNLTSVVIPESIEEVGIRIFSKCKNLYHIRYLGTKEQFKRLNFVKEHFEYTPVETIFCSDGSIELSELRGQR